MSRTLAIFEPEADGHHMRSFVRTLVAEALKRDWRVHLVTTARAQKHPAYAEIATEFGGQISVHVMEDAQSTSQTSDFGRIWDHFRRWKNYRAAYRKLPIKPDCIYMVNLDQADFAMGILGSPFGKTPFVGSIMGRQFHGPVVGLPMELGIRDKVFRPLVHRMLRIKTLTAMLCGDPKFIEYFHKLKLPGHQKAHYVPDIAETPLFAHEPSPKAALGVNESSIVVLTFGSQAFRKGIREFVAAILAAPENVIGVIAGVQDEATQRFLQALPDKSRLIIREGFQTEQDQSLLFQAADVVWVGYMGWFGMSGVLVQAGLAKKPVIAMKDGVIGYFTAQNELGITLDPADTNAVANAIDTLTQNPAQAAVYGANGNKFAQGHTAASWGKSVADFLENA